ncbi:chaperone modulator CbpM [Spirosoma sp. KNUC1025]|uniref:chaperone modulator CbpM n=1 Tax=Spirosoma sp. KNUC1025 TaxID=2894082 RepID=UPI00386DCC09|nr:chaperone modulator CbpM [Spirosoma sp. KNUC1025]
MQPSHLISIREFCIHHQVEITFVETLASNGLIETTTIERAIYIEPDQLIRLEKFVRLNQDLSIHTDDLDIVSDLLDRVENLQQQVTQLRNRLVFYEPL